jgi:hypothetical protein
MNTHAPAPLLLGGGLLLVLLSFAAPRLLGGRLEWSKADAVKLQQASQNYHAALHTRSHAHTTERASDDQLTQARDEYLRQQQSLEAARSRGSNVGGILRWIGIVCSVVGLALYLVPIVIGEPKPPQ